MLGSVHFWCLVYRLSGILKPSIFSTPLHKIAKIFHTPIFFCKIFHTLSDKNSSDKSVEISAWCRKFCPTKDFVRRKFCPIFQYKSQVKIGQNCRNFDLLSKILSDEIFCPSKILSDEILSDKVSYKGSTSSRFTDLKKHFPPLCRYSALIEVVSWKWLLLNASIKQ